MKTIYNILALSLTITLLFSCNEDEISNNHQRHLLAVAIDGQVGNPDIPGTLEEDNTTTITTYKELDFSNLALDIVVSPGATVSPNSGTSRRFYIEW